MTRPIIVALAAIAALQLASASSATGVNVVRTLVAGVFTYMALFELAPPHTHSRAEPATCPPIWPCRQRRCGW